LTEPSASAPAPRIASAYVELAFAALAHLAPGDADRHGLSAFSSAHDARYLTWAHAALPPAAWRPLAEDASTIASLLAAAPARDVVALQLLPALHDDLDHLVRTARRPLAELSEADVADATVLAALTAVAPAIVELLRCGMLLCAPAWRSAHAATIAPELSRARDAVAPWLSQVTQRAPSLARHRVELTHALGVRGRAFGAGRICVGAPCPWNGLPPEHAALQALHEIAVCAAVATAPPAQDEQQRWAWTEAAALAAVTELVRGSPLESAHQAWSARFDLRAIGDADRDAQRAVIAALRAGGSSSGG
jgi:hypothetical protein